MGDMSLPVNQGRKATANTMYWKLVTMENCPVVSSGILSAVHASGLFIRIHIIGADTLFVKSKCKLTRTAMPMEFKSMFKIIKPVLKEEWHKVVNQDEKGKEKKR